MQWKNYDKTAAFQGNNHMATYPIVSSPTSLKIHMASDVILQKLKYLTNAARYQTHNRRVKCFTPKCTLA